MYTRLLDALLEGETQFATQWLQFTVIFCMVWGIGGTVSGEHRQALDTWFRQVLLDHDPDITRPKSLKLSKAQIFPDKENIFSWYYDKKNNGTWVSWIDFMEKNPSPFPPTAKVIIIEEYVY